MCLENFASQVLREESRVSIGITLTAFVQTLIQLYVRTYSSACPYIQDFLRSAKCI